MTVELSASCPCGYSAYTAIGHGLLEVEQLRCPAQCKRCRKVVTVNLACPDSSCPSCNQAVLLYPNEDLPPGKVLIAEWLCSASVGVLRIWENAYTCPACGADSLYFCVTCDSD